MVSTPRQGGRGRCCLRNSEHRLLPKCPLRKFARAPSYSSIPIESPVVGLDGWSSPSMEMEGPSEKSCSTPLGHCGGFSVAGMESAEELDTGATAKLA